MDLTVKMWKESIVKGELFMSELYQDNNSRNGG